MVTLRCLNEDTRLIVLSSKEKDSESTLGLLLRVKDIYLVFSSEITVVNTHRIKGGLHVLKKVLDNGTVADKRHAVGITNLH